MNDFFNSICSFKTWYGSQFDEGLLSSKYPVLDSATTRGIRIEHPRLATPAEKSWMEEVSWFPAKRRSMSLPKFFLSKKFP